MLLHKFIPFQRLIIIFFTLGATIAHATSLTLGMPFSDHMVIQAGKPARIWGTDSPGVNVIVEFAGQSGNTVANVDGKWRIDLPAFDYFPENTSHRLTVRDETQSLHLEDVVVGEVWLCSGQSNMRFTLGRHAEPRDADAPLLYPNILAGARHAQIRLLNVSGGTPANQIWAQCSPETVADFSAIGYHFGFALSLARNVPVGLIDLGKGGAAIRTFISDETFYAHPEFGENYPPERRPGFMVGGVYRNELRPFAPFQVRGVLWYQGESDVSRASLYPKLLTCMINDWRSILETPTLPFLVVQLPPWERRRTDPPRTSIGYHWAELRHAQTLVTQEIPATFLVSIADLGERLDIHPRRKREVGERLAMLARAAVYNEPIPASGPTVTAVSRSDSVITLTFAHSEGGLLARGGELQNFEIISPDDQVTLVKAQIISYDQIRIECPTTLNAEVIRYAWRDFYEPTLLNGNGWPARPFRVLVPKTAITSD